MTYLIVGMMKKRLNEELQIFTDRPISDSTVESSGIYCFGDL